MRALICFLFFAAPICAQSPTPAAKFPAMQVQVTVGTSQRRLGQGFQKVMEIRPKVTIEGLSRMIALPEMQAVMMVLTMDTRAKYISRKEVYKVHATDSLPLPSAPSGERRQLAFPESTVIFDSYRDTSNIGGEVYKYYVFGLRDAATRTLVAFDTNFPQLAAFCKTHPERRDGFLALKKDEKFPEDLK